MLVSKKSDIIGLIPARLNSTRLPEKPLANLLGKSMVQRVYESAIESIFLSDVIVLTDHAKIYDHVFGFGGKALMTSESCQTGTERILEVYAALPNYDIYLNIQGDEPLIHSSHLDQVSRLMLNHKFEYAVGSLALEITNHDELVNPNICKVVLNANNQAMYFSRSAIPFVRNQDPRLKHYKHMGLYAYTNSFLRILPDMSGSPLEISESLEQLKWLYNSVPIYLDITDRDTIAIDTEEDLNKVIAVLREQNV